MPRAGLGPLFLSVVCTVSAFACGKSDDPFVPWGDALDASTESPQTTDGGARSDNVTQPPFDSGISVRSTVAVGGSFACVVARDRTVWCWGKNDVGQLGRAPSATPSCGAFPCSADPVKVDGLANVRSIALGEDFGCALDLANDLKCWGNNSKNQLGGSSRLAGVPFSPTPVATMANAEAVSAGGAHACAIGAAKLVYCWGENTCGIFGESAGASLDVARQIQVPQMNQISVAADAMCSTLPDGRAFCWGADHSGSLGHPVDSSAKCGGFPSDPVPKAVMGEDGLPVQRVADVHVGNGVACLRNQDGKVYCWGDNSRGALGQGVAEASSHPTALAVPAMFAERLEVGGQTACVIAADRALCWGDGPFGQLDAVSPSPSCSGQCRALAHPIDGMTPVRDVVVGPGSVAAIKDDLTLWLWGRNGSGELGVGPGDAANQTCSGTACIQKPRKLTSAPPID